MDLSALKDSKTTLPGLGMICLTILILAGKVPVEFLLQKLPWDYIVAGAFGLGGSVLLGVNSAKPPASPGIQAAAPPAPSQAPPPPAPPAG